MAPLGADDEAAGAPPSPTEVKLALRAETRRPQSRLGDTLGWAWLLVIFVAVLILAVLGWAFFSRS